MERYEKVKFLGRGTYGEVWMALDKKTNSSVAVKQIRIVEEGEGIHFTALREIMILQELKHPNVIQLSDIFYKNSNIHLVIELAENALNDLIPKLPEDEALTKGLMKQILEGVAYMHENSVLHRDLKPGNLLVTKSGEVKVTDFGTAKIICDSDAPKSTGICTLWYQSPELLFGTKHYGKSMDMWSVGCIFAELLSKHPFFPGNSAIDQLSKIFNTLGTPSEDEWTGMNYLPNYLPFSASPRISFKRAFPKASDSAIKLLSELFTYNPSKRISAHDALESDYFASEPFALSPSEISSVINNLT